VKWFFLEPGTEDAQALLSSSERLIAPALIRVEVTAALTRKSRVGEILPDEAKAVCRLWFSALSKGIITLSPDEENIEAAMEIAVQIRHPLQDCLYLALARRTESSLLTADPKFAERARGFYGNVQLLSQKGQ
jgi:predicted nucleic acid-binding protein